jgi:hypothetical protein
MPANRRELDSLVKRKTSTNLGSTERSSMLIQLKYILYKYGWFKMFLTFIYRHDNQTVKMPAFVDACECKITSHKQSIPTQNSHLVFWRRLFKSRLTLT